MASDTDQVRLTDLVSCGGCAAKYSAALLQDLVGGLGSTTHPDLLVGLAPSDDASVYRLDRKQALVFTLDFFPPIVDDPADFGSIAAANALNDIFAMGARPLVALSIAAFPESLPRSSVVAVLDAAAAKVREAGGVLAGGHTLRDDEPVYGLAVVGTVHPDQFWTKAGARPGDIVFLSKPLGTGLLVHSRKSACVEDAALREAVRWMQRLNAGAAHLLRRFEPNAVTDVTGFGLIGHAYEVAQRSSVCVKLDASALPLLPTVLALATDGVRTGGDSRNRDYALAALTIDGASEAQVAIAFDPQTSGGLLAAVPPEGADGLERAAAASGVFLARIGSITDGHGVQLVGGDTEARSTRGPTSAI